jgi:prepilin-type N-terminal cleavage/methylation domain-containing protein
MKKQQSGFTLIEIAIVLVIIGLLLGGILKGQELITAARVRNIISNQDGIKAAYFGFLDRYRALPGDYASAQANIPGCSGCQNGNGNGQITANGVAGADHHEYISAWEHLAKAGFITGNYVYNATESTSTTPSNPYGVPIRLIYDNVYRDGTADTGTDRHNLKTGANIPSDILAEVDRKIDDGMGHTGQFRHSTYGGSGTFAQCTNNNAWQSATPFANCGGTSLF